MNYQHLYHAGNFADVLKHSILLALLKKLLAKDTPFQFLDTHAGIGCYDLTSEATQKSQEYLDGIFPLYFSSAENRPAVIEDYLKIIKKINPIDKLLFYPGSPVIAHSQMRDKDQLVLCELHPASFLTLKNQIKQKNIALHHMDGYLGLKAFLPPKLKRGLVLIDPPFEKTDEFSKILLGAKAVLKFWLKAILMIWYPIKDILKVTGFREAVKSLKVPYLDVAFSLKKRQDNPGLLACGVMVINPPWQLKEEVTEILSFLEASLGAKAKIDMWP